MMIAMMVVINATTKKFKIMGERIALFLIYSAFDESLMKSNTISYTKTINKDIDTKNIGICFIPASIGNYCD